MQKTELFVTTVKFKSFASKSYASVSTGFSLGNYYSVSSSNYTGYDYSNQYLLNLDPTNADFNINYCSLDLGNSNINPYINSGTQFTGLYNNTVNVVTVGSPFVS